MSELTSAELAAYRTLDFMECDTCRAVPGTPPLCVGCLHNRMVIGALMDATHPKLNGARSRAEKLFQAELTRGR